MKKTLLLFLVILCSLIASAQITPTRFANTLSKKEASRFSLITPQQDVTRASSGFTLSFCGELSSWFYLVQTNKVNYRCFLYIDETLASKMAGNKITEIIFSATLPNSGQLDGSVFVGEKSYSKPENVTECKVIDSYDQYNAGGSPFQRVTLDEPYVIKENQAFFFGYEVRNCKYSQVKGPDYPVGVDYLAPNGFSGYVDITNASGEELAFVDMAQDVGTNLFLAAVTEGPVQGLENIFVFGNMQLGEFQFPIRKPADNTPFLLPVSNIGSNALTSIEYKYNVNGADGDVQTTDINVAAHNIDYIQLPAPSNLVEGKNNVVLDVFKVNGVDASLKTAASCYVLDDKDAYARKFVVEEGTGSWCGYCPRGIVGMEKMSEKYPDTFIGIAVHSGDTFESPTYGPLCNVFDGFPNCVVNRDLGYLLDPSFEELEEAYKLWSTQKSPAEIKLTVEDTENGLKATAATTFAYDEKNANYSIAFAIIEDGLIGAQKNYYSGYPEELEWWGDQGETVTWTYKETAIDIFDLAGMENSIPNTIVGGQQMTFSADLSTSRVKDKNNTSVIALLLDGDTGSILNATKVTARDYVDASAIEVVTDNANTPVEYFDLCGRRINTQVNGKTVIRVADKTAKIVLVK